MRDGRERGEKGEKERRKGRGESREGRDTIFLLISYYY